LAALRSLQDVLQVTSGLKDWRVRLVSVFINATIQFSHLESDLPALREEVPVKERAAFDTLHQALSHPISDAEASRIIDNMTSPEKTRNTWR